MDDESLDALLARVRACTHCAAHLPHGARPIVQAGAGARIALIGQAPGSRVHASGVPWDGDSGERLRGWLGIGRGAFHDPGRVALVPMGLCYPGKGTGSFRGGDLPPRKECAPLWHERIRAAIPNLKLTLVIGQYAQKTYVPRPLRGSMTETVRRFAQMLDELFPLPHPAWRARLWREKHPWFEAEALPALSEKVAAALA